LFLGNRAYKNVLLLIALSLIIRSLPSNYQVYNIKASFFAKSKEIKLPKDEGINRNIYRYHLMIDIYRY